MGMKQLTDNDIVDLVNNAGDDDLKYDNEGQGKLIELVTVRD
jgi:hypothetical protein